MAHEFAYPVTLTPDETDGGFVVTFQDVPEAITQGETVTEALAEAADALEEAIAGRIRRGDSIPDASLAADRPKVPVPAQTAAKAALYLALKERESASPSWPPAWIAMKRKFGGSSIHAIPPSCRGFKGHL